MHWKSFSWHPGTFKGTKHVTMTLENHLAMQEYRLEGCCSGLSDRIWSQVGMMARRRGLNLWSRAQGNR